MDLRKSYKESGVNVEEGYKAVSKMKEHLKSTFNEYVFGAKGAFAGLFDLSIIKDLGIENPVLVSGTDGVGTKLKIAFMMNKHDTIGKDLLAMSVNDILCHGARPLFFLDYFATGKLDSDVAATVVSSISKAAKEIDCAIIGGETAEMSGFYKEGEYDLAGFAVGIVDKSKIIDSSSIKTGDKIIALKSSGFHSNGYSLIRKVLFEDNNFDLDMEFNGSSLGDEILKPTRIYVNEILKTIEIVNIKSAVHVTGGGFNENFSRILPSNLDANIYTDKIIVPKIISSFQDWAKLSKSEMYATFNMGVGFAIVVSESDVDKALSSLNSNEDLAYVIGEITNGECSVNII